jgi:Tfp pilus assembly protein PilN
MIFTKSSLGLEICGNDLRLAVTRSSFGKLRLMGLHQIPDFVTLSEEDRKKAIKALVKMHSIPTRRVYLTVSREHGIVRQLDLPVEMVQKLGDVVKLQVETLSPWPMEEIYWDFVEQHKKNQKLMTVTIAIITRTVLDPWIAFFKSAGLPLRGATLSSLAYGHGATALWKQAAPTVILHQETAYVEGTVINGSRIAALTGPSSEDGTVMTAFMERLLAVAKLRSADGFRLVQWGGNLKAPAAADNPPFAMENANSESTLNFGPIATAMFPLKDSPFKSNLIPRELRFRESQAKLIPTYVLGSLVLCAALALLGREPYQSVVYASRLQGEIRKIAPTVAEVANQEAELNLLTAKARALTTTLENHDYNMEVMRELARVLPPSAFLGSYSYQDGTISISGFAQSASEVQSLLESSPTFKGVEFTNSVTREANGKDRFTLKIALEVHP